MENSRIAIIGYGNIGEELHERLVPLKCRSILTVQRHQYCLHEYLGANSRSLHQENGRPSSWDGIDLAFLAIPTEDDGSTALSYMSQLLEKGIPVVTCEKGALANYFKTLQPYLNNIGYSATVGGGSGLIDALRARAQNHLHEIHLILNGTLNDVWHRLAEGTPLGQAILEAQRLGYVEPGSHDPIEIIEKEVLSDAIKKTVILFNLCFGVKDYVIDTKTFGYELSSNQIHEAVRKAGSQRFVISFQRLATRESHSFYKPARPYLITAGFRNLDDPIIARLATAAPGVSNGFLTVEGKNGTDGTCLHIGPGAGPGPTAAAMIRDAERLLAK